MVIKKMRNQIVVLAFCFLGCYSIIFSMNEALCETNHWKAFTPIQSSPTSFKISVLEASKSRIIFKINVPGAYITSIKSRQKNYYRMTVPGIGYTEDVGKPMLPEIVKLVAIPSSCTSDDINIQIISVEFSDFQGYQLCPVPTQIKKRSPDGMDYFVSKYETDPEIYSTNSFYPNELIKIEKIGFIRDQKVIWLTIHPIQYNPVTNEVEVYYEIEIGIDYDGDPVVVERGIGPFDEVSKILFLNNIKHNQPSSLIQPYNGKVTFPTNLLEPSNSADYLIITTEGLCTNSSLDLLAQHRAEYNGFDVAIVKTSDIYQQFAADSEKQSIKNFIIYAYNHWQAPHFGDGHLGYVLLVGDGAANSSNRIAPHYYYDRPLNSPSDTSATDYWYACVNDDDGNGLINDDDYIADLIIGRFSVDNGEELNAIALKTIHFEENLALEETWKRKISLISCFVFWEAPGKLGNLYDDLRGSVAKQDFYEIAEEYKRSEIEPTFIRDAFLKAFNEGRAIINVNAHGGKQNWGDSHGWLLFSASDISDLNNGDKLPIVLSIACNTGWFDDLEIDCLGELLLNTPNRGAVAFLGSSRPTIGSPLNKAFFYNLVTKQNVSIGASLFAARLVYDLASHYNLLGDPGISLLTKPLHGLSDLHIDSRDINVMWSPFDEPAKVSAKIYNLGFIDANQVIVQFFNGDPQAGGRQIGEDQIITTIARFRGWDTAQIEIDQKIIDPISLYIIVDPYDRITELDENNNMACIFIKEPVFVDVAAAAGVADTASAWNAAFGDFNNDGALDIYILNLFHSNILYRNNNSGIFSDVSLEAGVADSGDMRVTTFVDYDNNGYLDIYLFSQDKGNIFYRNKGDSNFTPTIPGISNGKPLTDRILGFIDYDCDGLLDLYCSRGWKEPNVLYKNMSNETFKDVTNQAGLDSGGIGQNVAFGDYDNDGDLDFYVTTYLNTPDILYENIGEGKFLNVTEKSGIGHRGVESLYATFGDYDNDGDLDLLVLYDDSYNALYENKGNGAFNDVTEEVGIEGIGWCPGAMFLDYNNDGCLDLYIPFSESGDIIFRNNGNGSFTKDVTAIDIIRTKASSSTAIGDYDNDGSVDIYKAVSFGINYDRLDKGDAGNILYRNKGNDDNWLIVNTRGTQSNSFGIGARVRVVSGDLSQIRDVTCEFGNDLQTSLPIEFGLGKHSQIDTVEVRWPSGIIDVLTSVKVNTILTVKEGYGDISIPGTHQLSQNYPNPFNATTTIQYTIRGNPHAPQTVIHVSIGIYNILGQEVITLVNESKEAGCYSIQWDGKDRNGRQLASGVYLYQLKAEEFVKTKKLLLLR